MYAIFLITILPLFYTIVSSKSVYHVRPDDEGFLSNNSPSAHTLNYYLLNASKYFTYNAELKFLSGVHQLDAVIMIKDTHHFALTGSSRNGTINSIIECPQYGGIVIINSSYINIQDLILKDCNTALDYALYLKNDIVSRSSFASLLINNSHSLNIFHVTTYQISFYNIVLINVFNSNLSTISSNGIAVIYNNIVDKNYSAVTNNKNALLLHAYNSVFGSSSFTPYEMVLNFIEYPCGIQVQISSVQFKSDKAIFVYSYANTVCNGINKVNFINCSFDDIKCVENSDEQDSIITISVDNYSCFRDNKQTNLITFMNCSFSNNENRKPLPKYIINFQNINSESLLYIVNSQFCNNNGTTILAALASQDSIYDTFLPYIPGTHLSVIISNVTFSRLLDIDVVMILYNTDIKLEGPVLFSEMEINMAVVYGKRMRLVFSDYIEFSDIDTFYIIVNECVYLSPNTYIYLTSNVINDIFLNYGFYYSVPVYSRPCMFQYISNNYHQDFVNIHNFNTSIIITETTFANLCTHEYCATHCRWVGDALFEKTSPLVVNRQIIKFADWKDANKTISDKKNVCYCTDSYSYSCYLDEINVYPGQTFHLQLISTITNVNYLTVTVNNTMTTSCRVAKTSEIEQRVYNNCTSVYFTIHYYKKWCELFLSYSAFGADIDIFYINFLPCPTGFSLNQLEGYCQCDPILTSTTIISISCNINDQTILRPGNSWICTTSNHTYQVSSPCPFRYCLPNPSSFNLSNPDSQCQFKRSGFLCGKCQKDLSTIFGTSNCKPCSNAFLFITAPIALAGIALLLLLFMLNVTVTDGAINAFILYVNIVSINSSIIFTHQSTAHIFVSLANLDLGFEMCFYNGMDDYTKTWLQLAFPVYLIIIATLLIVGSRYSTKVQRLTARRTLAVLATLFLLSYTKILRTVSKVLFFYSRITDLPSNKTTIVWSIDANIPLFGAKFTALFTACLILLLIIIIPFNVVLTFTRILSRHRMINYFKPLLDAYQGPYKNRYYFWPGLQLLIRAIFFGLSALDKNINLAIGLVLLAAMLGIHGYVRPFKSSFKNIQELVFIFNLIVLFVFVQFENTNNIIVNTSVIIASIHFIIILLNNLRLYQCLPVLESISRKNKRVIDIKQCIINKWMHLIKRNRSHNDYMQNIPLRDVVPEVAYNFKEYQEPLIGQED